MILIVKVSSNLVSNFEEVSHVYGVTNIRIEVILEMLKHFHVLLHILISSHSWEGESFIVKFPGVYLKSCWFGKFCLDILDIGPVSWVKGS